MSSPISIVRRTILATAASVLAFCSLAFVPLQGVAAADCDPTPPPDSYYGAGVHHPVGADAATFTYDCNSGTWSNAYYIYYPASNSRVATYPPNYAYDCSAGKWYMDEYDFSSATGTYQLNRVVASDPGLPTGCPVPASSGSSDPNNPSSTISNTGPNSNNTTSTDTTLNNTTTNNNNLNMNNGLTSTATTGNAFVLGNTSGGNALSGNAQTLMNIANLLQSSSNVFGPNTDMFTANINGDVNGDFMFDPSALISNTGPGSNNTSSNNLTVNTNNTNNTNAQINNNINANATSGNATVAGNTAGGNATSGSAAAIVNLMNLINSSVSAGHSFIGTININGNLNGDILLPPNFINQLLASTGPGSNNSANTNLTDNSTTTNNTNESINNNITSAAQSGNANVSNNTKGGSATTGQAGTNLTLLNLTGSNVVGQNDLLVFVNVLGHWVGMIVNAPTGATAASLGGGITNSGPNSNNATNTNVTDNSNTTNNTNLGINNNVNVRAQSGDASVTDNTLGGNATSGNAHTAVNILNMEGSNLSLANWFGILFINVFGNWYGSFGINTSAGDPVANSSSKTSGSGPMAQFIPRSTLPGASNRDYYASFVANNNQSNAGNSSSQGVVLAAKTSKGSGIKLPGVSSISPAQKVTNKFLLPGIGIAFAFAILFAGERRSRAASRQV